MHRLILLIPLVLSLNISCKQGNGRARTTETVQMDSTKAAAEPKELAVSSPFPDLGPDFSPDGSQIAFYSYTNKDYSVSRLYIMRTDGTELRELSTRDTLGFHTEPKWSPDGQRIAYTSFLETGARMMVIDREGSRPQKLASVSENGFHMFSSWDASGEGYYFFHWPNNEGFEPDAYYAHGGKVIQLTHDGITNRPQLASNGSLFINKIVDLEQNLFDKYILDPGSRELQKIPQLEGEFISGDRVIKQKEDDQGTTFVLEDLNGKDLKELGTVPYSSLMFSRIGPKGRFVAYNTSFEDGAEIHLLDARTGKYRKLTQNGE